MTRDQFEPTRAEHEDSEPKRTMADGAGIVWAVAAGLILWAAMLAVFA